MTITATEFKTNFEKYMELVKTEDILVTKNGKINGIFTNPCGDPLQGLVNIGKGHYGDFNEEKAKEDIMKERYGL